MDQQYPQVLPTGPWLLPGNTAGGAWVEAGSLEPSWLRCCSCCLQDLLASSGGTSPVHSAEPASRCLYSSRLSPWCDRICILSVFPLPTLSNHFALESLQIFPLQMPSWGIVLSTRKGHLQAWADQASQLGWSLKRHPLNFSTKCLFFHSCHHL